MSQHKLVVINCDECGINMEFDTWVETAKDSRAEARAAEWHVGLPGGRDICADCWEEGKR